MAKKDAKENKKGSFLDAFNAEKVEGVSTSAPAPQFWLDTGSLMLNHILSGSYDKGWASGRLGAIVGPSGAGKSFLAAGAIKQALDIEWGVLAIDSENALDDDFLLKMDANITDNPFYNYRGVDTIPQCLSVVQKFIKNYKTSKETMPFLIVIDSLDMLMTQNEFDQYEEGEMSGDQGQQAKQIKALLKRFVNDVKGTNIHMLCTKQAYKEQDKIAAFTNPWVINEAFKFAFSQMLLVSKFMLKDDKTKIFEGINLKARGEKTRFAKPFQQVTIEVPYETGMDRFTGLLDAAAALGIVKKEKAWYTYGEIKFQKSNFEKVKDDVFKEIMARESEALNVQLDPDEAETDYSGVITAEEATALRKTKGKSSKLKTEDTPSDDSDE